MPSDPTEHLLRERVERSAIARRAALAGDGRVRAAVAALRDSALIAALREHLEGQRDEAFLDAAHLAGIGKITFEAAVACLLRGAQAIRQIKDLDEVLAGQRIPIGHAGSEDLLEEDLNEDD